MSWTGGLEDCVGLVGCIQKLERDHNRQADRYRQVRFSSSSWQWPVAQRGHISNHSCWDIAPEYQMHLPWFQIWSYGTIVGAPAQSPDQPWSSKSWHLDLIQIPWQPGEKFQNTNSQAETELIQCDPSESAWWRALSCRATCHHLAPDRNPPILIWSMCIMTKSWYPTLINDSRSKSIPNVRIDKAINKAKYTSVTIFQGKAMVAEYGT